ncbi:MAG: hypothetical protein ACI9HK_002612 [Pirellulaceae bacterium]|jgi:hypothetical protein
MWKYLTIALLLCAGCGKAGNDVTTTTPSQEYVARCRAEMYIRDDVDIHPKGFKLITGMDDAIWFKFVTKAENILDVFDDEKVDTSKFSSGFKIDNASMPTWWDVNGRKLLGGQIQLPQGRAMNVGSLKNGDETLTVYVMWFET